MTDQPEKQIALDLPEFEGQVPVGVLTKLNGTGQRIHRPLAIGHRVVVVVEAEVTGVNHVEDASGLKRIQSLKVHDLYEAEGKEGKKLLSSMRLAAKRVDDARNGRQALPGVDEEPKTDHGQTLDNNGVALTPEEIAAAKGESVPESSASSELTNDEDPVTLIFKDNSRALWPDDYDLDVDTPFAGDFLPNPNNKTRDELQIMKVLDVETGDVIEEWNDEKEADRLKVEEERLAAEEAAEAAKAKPKKAKKVKAPKVIADEITPVLEADAAAPALPGETE